MLQLQQQQQMRLTQQRKRPEGDMWPSGGARQADEEGPPEVPIRRSSVQVRPARAPKFDPSELPEPLLTDCQPRRPVARAPHRPPPPPPPPSVGVQQQPLPPPPPPLPPLPLASCRAWRQAPKDIWSPSSSSLSSTGECHSGRPTKQLVAPASSTSPPSSSVHSTVIEKSQRPLARDRPDIVELGESGQELRAPPVALLGEEAATQRSSLGGGPARSRSVSVQERQPKQSRSYSIAAPGERNAHRQQVESRALDQPSPSSNSLGRGGEERLRDAHRYWTLPAPRSGRDERLGAATGEAEPDAYGRIEASQRDDTAYCESSSDAQMLTQRSSADLNAKIPFGAHFHLDAQLHQPDSSSPNIINNSNNADISNQTATNESARSQANRASLRDEQVQLASNNSGHQGNMKADADRDSAQSSSSIKDEWLRQMYRQMHKPTPERSQLLKAANSQPDTSHITVKLKSPKTG